MYWCWETWEDIWCAYLFFSGFYKYGKNTGLSRLKTGSRKYRRDKPSPVFYPISVFFHKYKNGRNKYKNTNGTEFFPSVGMLSGGRHGRRSGEWTGLTPWPPCSPAVACWPGGEHAQSIYWCYWLSGWCEVIYNYIYLLDARMVDIIC